MRPRKKIAKIILCFFLFLGAGLVQREPMNDNPPLHFSVEVDVTMAEAVASLFTQLDRRTVHDLVGGMSDLFDGRSAIEITFATSMLLARLLAPHDEVTRAMVLWGFMSNFHLTTDIELSSEGETLQ